MLKIAVLVSGGGTNLQAIIDAIADGTITDTQIVTVISNNAGAYALERANAAGIAASCISPKNYRRCLTRRCWRRYRLPGRISSCWQASLW